jgi:peptidyl-prolyl cis-trans isomerase SurA
MDAPIRRWTCGLLLGTLAAGSLGCGMLGQEVDDRVGTTLSDPTLPKSKTRAQSPPPLDLPPAAPTAPIVPLAGPTPAPPVREAALQPVTSISARPLVDRMNATPTSQVKVVATVGPDIIVTDEEVSMMMKQRAKDYIALTGDERKAKEKECYREELRKLIERELLLNDFLSKVKKNKPQMIDELWDRAARMTDDHLRVLKKMFNLKTEAELTAEMERQGLSYKLFRRQIERESMVSQFLSSVLREKNGTPTVQEVHAYYDQHQNEFQSTDRVKFQDLFVANGRFNSTAEAKAYADDLWKKLLAGADFVTTVKEKGHGDSLLREGAGVGEKRGEIRPAELEETVFSIKAGNISAVVPTESGYHIIKVLERDVAGVRKFDDKLQSEIRTKLMNQGLKVERDKMVTALWRSTGVTIQEENPAPQK